MIQRSEDVVQAAYNLLLSREPEPVGLKHWASALDNGLSRAEFLRAVLASAEFRQSMAAAEDLTTFHDVDLIIPAAGRRFRVPAGDTSLVPYLLKHRCWEPHVMSYLTRELQASFVFMDVGANLGYFTVLCAPLVSQVIAFEPVTRTYAYCHGNIALNGLTNVDLRPCGLWHENAVLHVKTDSSSVMTAAVVPNGYTSTDEVITVASLDSLVAAGELRLSRLDVIKMDAEGAELSALIGMRRTLARFRPRLVMEINRPMLAALGATIDDVWEFFGELGYSVSVFEPWKEQEPAPVASLEELKRACPSDTLVDVLAISQRG